MTVFENHVLSKNQFPALDVDALQYVKQIIKFGTAPSRESVNICRALCCSANALGVCEDDSVFEAICRF